MYKRQEDQDKMDLLFTRQGELQDIIDATDAWNLDSKLERAMDALRCPPEDQLVENLSGGERRRVALCRLLLQKPDILLLDEPTNHLDAESIDWLEQHLQQYEGTVIAVTHDRYFLEMCIRDRHFPALLPSIIHCLIIHQKLVHFHIKYHLFFPILLNPL